jgi:hypothetical protein
MRYEVRFQEASADDDVLADGRREVLLEAELVLLLHVGVIELQELQELGQ